MFRKLICTLSAVVILLTVCSPTQAASGFSDSAPFVTIMPSENIINTPVYQEIVNLTESPKTGDYPSPFFTAMLLSLAVVVIMVLAENREK